MVADPPHQTPETRGASALAARLRKRVSAGSASVTIGGAAAGADLQRGSGARALVDVLSGWSGRVQIFPGDEAAEGQAGYSLILLTASERGGEVARAAAALDALLSTRAAAAGGAFATVRLPRGAAFAAPATPRSTDDAPPTPLSLLPLLISDAWLAGAVLSEKGGAVALWGTAEAVAAGRAKVEELVAAWSATNAATALLEEASRAPAVTSPAVPASPQNTLH